MKTGGTPGETRGNHKETGRDTEILIFSKNLLKTRTFQKQFQKNSFCQSLGEWCTFYRMCTNT